MADYIDKHSENVPGRFYVDSTCISCVSCHSIAPAFFKLKNSNEYSFVIRQPATQGELEICEEALRECPVNAIGNDGMPSDEPALRATAPLRVPDPFNAAIARTIRKHGERIFLESSDTATSVTFAGFADKAERIRMDLERHGVAVGDVVALISDNSVDLACALLALLSHGYIAMPLNPKLTTVEMKTLLAHSDARLILAETEGGSAGEIGIPTILLRDLGVAAVAETAREPGDGIMDGPGGGLLIYTSGTTGNPKGVLLSGANIAANVEFACAALGLDQHHVTLCLLPLFHTFAFISDLATMAFCGGKAAIIRTFDLARISEIGIAIRASGVRSFSAVPLIFEMLIRMDADLAGSGLRFCVSGAAPLSEKIRLGFKERFGAEIIPAYGLTECTCFCTISQVGGAVEKSAGRPAGVEILILDDSERPLPPMETGEIAVKGPSVFAGGYFRYDLLCYTEHDPSLFKTGDLGHRDSHGNIYVTGRKKNMVIRGGEKVYVEDVDACIKDLEGVRDVATVKSGDGSIESVVCFLVPEKGGNLDLQRIRRSILERIGALKCPDRFLIVDRIPRTSTNKVKIRELAEAAGNAA